MHTFLGARIRHVLGVYLALQAVEILVHVRSGTFARPRAAVVPLGLDVSHDALAIQRIVRKHALALPGTRLGHLREHLGGALVVRVLLARQVALHLVEPVPLTIQGQLDLALLLALEALVLLRQVGFNCLELVARMLHVVGQLGHVAIDVVVLLVSEAPARGQDAVDARPRLLLGVPDAVHRCGVHPRGLHVDLVLCAAAARLQRARRAAAARARTASKGGGLPPRSPADAAARRRTGHMQHRCCTRGGTRRVAARMGGAGRSAERGSAAGQDLASSS